MFLFGKVALLGVTDFHGLDDDLKFENLLLKINRTSEKLKNDVTVLKNSKK